MSCVVYVPAITGEAKSVGRSILQCLIVMHTSLLAIVVLMNHAYFHQPKRSNMVLISALSYPHRATLDMSYK